MPSATQPQPLPNPLIYDFEGQFEDAFVAGFSSEAVQQVAQQQSTVKLITPGYQCKFMSGAQEQESYIVPNTGTAAPNSAWSYQNRWKGTLFIKVVTNRLNDRGIKIHRTARATLRLMMINYQTTVNPFLKFISIVQSLESSTQADIVPEKDHDISAIAFNVFFSIKNSAFPVPT